MYINAELIESIVSAPDTQVVLTDGNRIYVTETPEEVVKKIIEYKRLCNKPDALPDIDINKQS
jgi:flagellar protein FlbD